MVLSQKTDWMQQNWNCIPMETKYLVKNPEIYTGKMTEPLRNGVGQPGWLHVKESK